MTHRTCRVGRWTRGSWRFVTGFAVAFLIGFENAAFAVSAQTSIVQRTQAGTNIWVMSDSDAGVGITKMRCDPAGNETREKSFNIATNRLSVQAFSELLKFFIGWGEEMKKGNEELVQKDVKDLLEMPGSNFGGYKFTYKKSGGVVFSVGSEADLSTEEAGILDTAVLRMYPILHNEYARKKSASPQKSAAKTTAKKKTTATNKK